VSRASSVLFTIVARNYVGFARTLMDSVAAFEPSLDRYVFLVDAAGDDDDALENVAVLTPSDVFGFEFYAGLAYSSDVTELSTAVKPFVLRHLLGLGYERAYYFDPDIELFAPLDPVTRPLENADIVLTPHTTDPIPLDGRLPDEIVLLRAGAYNLGFIGVARTAAALAMLDWWADRLERYCVNDVAAGLFTDQKWIDLVPGMVERVAIVRHRGCNVAYWNLHARRLTLDSPPRLESGEPLIFFHYSGFDIRNPKRLSSHQTRIDVTTRPELAALLQGYARRVAANGAARAATVPYGFGRFSNGVPLDRHSRTILREARLSGITFPDPGDVNAQPSAWTYLNARADEDADRRASPPLSRYLYAVWRNRTDLRTAFSDVLGADRERFVRWVLDDRTAAIHRAYLVAGGLRSAVAADEPEPERGVNVVGYFRTESGVGEAGRGQVAALREAGIPTSLIDFSDFAPSRAGDTTVDTSARADRYRTNVICVNADQVPIFMGQADPAFLADRYNIGSWWWEMPEFPDRWLSSFAPFDEIWVGTQFVASAVAPKSPVPVVVIPPVVDLGAVRTGRKSAFGFRDGETVFLFVFDYRSVFERKNPLGAVEAFRRAFPRGDERVRLVIKSINGDADPPARERLRRAAQNDRRIDVMNDYLTRAEKNELIAACDAYVSLHRSEGFGFTLAEAMALGKPVVGTPWSGPADYMTLSNSYPVEYELVALGDDYGPYAADQLWAEPDLDHAAHALRSIRERPEEAAQRGRRAAADIVSRYSPLAVARAIADRLARIDAQGRRLSSPNRQR
jgi:glycosyltransferase involved in cell wall biosynthesis